MIKHYAVTSWSCLSILPLIFSGLIAFCGLTLCKIFCMLCVLIVSYDMTQSGWALVHIRHIMFCFDGENLNCSFCRLAFCVLSLINRPSYLEEQLHNVSSNKLYAREEYLWFRFMALTLVRIICWKVSSNF